MPVNRIETFPLLFIIKKHNYDKEGNLKAVSTPTYANGNKASKPWKTKTGALLGGIGFGGVINSNVKA